MQGKPEVTKRAHLLMESDIFGRGKLQYIEIFLKVVWAAMSLHPILGGAQVYQTCGPLYDKRNL